MFELLKTTAASLAAIVAIGTVAWGFGTATGYRPWFLFEQNDFTTKQFQLVMDQTQQNTLALAQQKFDRLLGLRKLGEDKLTFDEKVSLCQTARVLEYGVTDEAGFPLCTKDWQPVFSFQPEAK